MNSTRVDEKLREKLEPHVEAIVDGSSTEYYVFPAILSTILNKQALLIQNQSDFANLIYSHTGELKVFRESNQESLAEIIRYINELKISQEHLVDLKFADLKIQQEKNIQVILNQQKSLESNLLVAQGERKAIKKNALINLILSVTSIVLLSGVLFVFLK